MNHEKQRSREKEKARERDREKEKARDREKDRLRDKDRERDRDRDRERDRERDRDEKDREWEEKERDWSRDRERDRDERDRDRERERDRDSDAKHKDKDKDDKKKERGKDRGKDADVRRDADLLKERKKDKEKRDRDVDKEKEKDRDKDREKDKGREKERDHEKERDREKEKEKEKDFEKERERRKDRDKDSRHEKDKEQERQKEQEKSLDLEVEHVTKDVDKGAVQQSRKGKGDSVSEIAGWVSKSRNLEEQKKIEERIKAARMARLLSEQDSGEESEEDDKTPAYGGKDLAGLKVLHGIDKVMEGGAVVLTLKDRGILDNDDVNDEVDELENLEISQQLNRDKAYRDAKKKPGLYEDKFQNDINAVRTILPQYDEEMEDGMTLDEMGGLNEEGRKLLDELRKKLQGVEPKSYQSLSGFGSVASDFYSQEEMLQFNKPKKKKKLRKKEVLDLDAMEAEAKAEGRGDADLGSRFSGVKQAQKLEKEKAAAESRKSAYLNAYTKAVDASQKLRIGSGTDRGGEDVVVFGVEDDDELERSLQRARQAALKKQAENGGSSSGPQAVVSALQQASEMEIETGSREDAGDRDKTALVFTETEEFCRNIQLDEILQRRPGTKDVFAEDDEPMEDEKPHGLDGGWMEVNEYSKAEKTVEKQAEEDPSVEEVVVEVAVGKGLSGALQLLKERGTLKETVEWGGRNMDKKKSKLIGLLDQEEKFKNKEILLERVDEFGRVMTPKEAFRKLSHKFHGKGPGKMKQEKRMKQFEEELKLKQMTSGDTPLLSMQKMREAQEKLQTPYLVISGHTQPGHTSDTGSSFGSIDKGSIGSLTPMLGDQKVEHFLGIKRKPEGGSMRPPLPKKPKIDK